MFGESSALADTLTLAQYRQRLETARSALVEARAMNPQGAVDRSRQQELYGMGWGFLQLTNGITLPSGETLDVDDAPREPQKASPLAGPFDAGPQAIDATIARVDTRLALVAMYERSWFGMHDPATSDAQRARELALRIAP